MNTVISAYKDVRHRNILVITIPSMFDKTGLVKLAFLCNEVFLSHRALGIFNIDYKLRVTAHVNNIQTWETSFLNSMLL